MSNRVQGSVFPILVAVGTVLVVIGVTSLDGAYPQLAMKLTIAGAGMLVLAGGMGLLIDYGAPRFGPDSTERESE